MKVCIAILFLVLLVSSCGQKKDNLPEFKETLRTIQQDTTLTLQEKEDEILKRYLEYNQIETQPLLSGAVIHKSKQTDNTPVMPGKEVTLHYTGKLIDGTVFDSSYERNTPLELLVGDGKMIMGFEQALTHLKEGEKAKIVLPSFLAYGEKGHSDKIPPYASLIFDVEILHVEK